jgi:cytochrome c-type biogenesis protein CcmF
MGVTVAGITGMSAWATEKVQLMRPGEGLQLSGFELRLNSVGNVPGPNYEAERASFDVTRKGRPVARLVSERRFYPVREQQTTAAGIRTNLISNLYVTLGEPDGKGAWAVRFYYHPFAPWIWLGALTMAVGGLVSLTDRRLRVGAPQRAPRQSVLVPAE